MKKWKYHKSHSYKIANEEVNALTQLYQIGVYMIINNEPSLQFNVKPKDMVKTEKQLIKEEENGKITELKFGSEITVIEDENGMYKELKE